jgi:hypothetical protein
MACHSAVQHDSAPHPSSALFTSVHRSTALKLRPPELRQQIRSQLGLTLKGLMFL